MITVRRTDTLGRRQYPGTRIMSDLIKTSNYHDTSRAAAEGVLPCGSNTTGMATASITTTINLS